MGGEFTYQPKWDPIGAELDSFRNLRANQRLLRPSRARIQNAAFAIRFMMFSWWTLFFRLRTVTHGNQTSSSFSDRNLLWGVSFFSWYLFLVGFQGNQKGTSSPKGVPPQPKDEPRISWARDKLILRPPTREKVASHLAPSRHVPAAISPASAAHSTDRWP